MSRTCSGWTCENSAFAVLQNSCPMKIPIMFACLKSWEKVISYILLRKFQDESSFNKFSFPNFHLMRQINWSYNWEGVESTGHKFENVSKWCSFCTQIQNTISSDFNTVNMFSMFVWHVHNVETLSRLFSGILGPVTDVFWNNCPILSLAIPLPNPHPY